ncbi:hypothetical protein [Streptomyces sp. PSAA01]|uniref:hypothetical protein n=1 Tax=Streptomyces sp. PSAA01 TaxID=2912762 RepID=UPI001F33D26E|nr:hypothetical protein [Streptomyces sp. PSAA01]MCG0290247.1 hypothetical protein [Streptomyces sp. PSAA01]
MTRGRPRRPEPGGGVAFRRAADGVQCGGRLPSASTKRVSSRANDRLRAPSPPYSLTPPGADGHAAVAERVGATRRRLMDGLTDDQYLETVRVLSRMAANLEGALA